MLNRLEDCSIPEYLINVVTYYFKDRSLQVERSETTGVPGAKGSILWSVAFDDILRLQFSVNVIAGDLSTI